MSLATKTLENVGFVVGSNAYTALTLFLSRIVLAWFLLPEVFGLFAIGSLFVGFLETFKGLGVAAALVHRKKEVKKAASTTFWIEIAASTTFFAAIFLIAPFIAGFFGDTRITLVARVLSLIFIFASLGTVNNFLLEKKLQFKKTVKAQVVSYSAYFASAVLLAFLGFGVWALVYSSIILSLVNTAMLYLMFSWRPKLEFDWRIAKELIGYGKFVLLSSMLTFLVLNFGGLVVGKMLGIKLLGFYSMALAVSNFPSMQASNVIVRVMFPTYSKIRDEKERLVAGFKKTMHYCCLASFLLSFGLVALASEFVSVVFGSEWFPMIAVMQVLALFGAVRAVGAISGSIFLAMGNPNLLALFSVVNLVLVAIFVVPLTVLFGMAGTAFVVALVGLVSNSLAVVWASRLVDVSLRAVAGVIGKPLVSAIAMALVLSWLKVFFAVSLASLVFLSLLGAFVFIVFNWFLNRDLISCLKVDLAIGVVK